MDTDEAPIVAAPELGLANSVNIELEDTVSLSLEEYLDQVSEVVKPQDLGSLLATAPHLRRLANNRVFLAEWINEQLKDFDSFHKDTHHGPRSFTLGGRGRVCARANVWLPQQKSSKIEGCDDDAWSHLVPHDHNCNFLTVGYFGPGFETLLYEYDRTQITGYIGEKVDVRFLGREQLTEGKVLCFRQGRDIHTHLHPPSLSISVSLIAASPAMLQQEEFCFDIQNQCISNFSSNSVTALVTSLEVAAHVGNEETCSILEIIARRHPAPRARSAAYQAIAKMRRRDAQSFWAKASGDASAHVRQVAREALLC